ncbi:acyl-CoA N-acyltransferase [Aureobasidium subglaciale]|nr:acyl-CoA N-acyltransferase [Aureobasidium subglaciale]KAI5219147.1 acyl-CoA N-acyltransferase [Aureobasidium subglaciale]KAI5233164.1 acyl-CoA N-acyltransferase [Aureobasidium subglaciale]KAI5260035.1 acyl-CoA N-acyltransferase [Aureobasidium subglaciale]
MAISNTTPISIRKATLHDAKALAELGTHVWTQTFGHTVSPADLQKYLNASYSTSAMEADITNPLKELIVATSTTNDIIGFTLMTKGSTEPCLASYSNHVELQRIYVHPDYHGTGVVELEALARKEGFEHMWLGVWEENARALGLYGKLGFKEVGKKKFLVGDQVDTDLVMVKAVQ